MKSKIKRTIGILMAFCFVLSITAAVSKRGLKQNTIKDTKKATVPATKKALNSVKKTSQQHRVII